jgi:hypothetical protein
MKLDEVAEVMAKPTSKQLSGSSIPARLAYTGIDREPRVIQSRSPGTGRA